MKRLKILSNLFAISIFSAVVLAISTPGSARAAFTLGNLAVEQLYTNGTSSTFEIVELNPNIVNSTPVNAYQVPYTGASALRQSSAGTDGRIALTADRTLLAFTGAEDSTGVSDETTILPRGVGTVNANGTYALQASYTGASGNQARSATSLNDTLWYFGDKGGIYTNGDTSPLNTANVGPMKSFGGAVDVLSAKSPNIVISTLSANGKTLTGLPGLAADANAVDFYMIASGEDGVTNDILYVNDGSKVTKYSLVSGSWVNNGQATLGVTADGFCAFNTGTNGAFLYVTTGTGGTVVKITDSTGYNTAPVIVTANNTVIYSGAAYLKGIDFAPIPGLATEQLASDTTSSTISIVELNPTLSNSVPSDTIAIPSTTVNALRQANNGSTGRLSLTGDRKLLAFTGANDPTGVSDETTVNARGVGTIDSSPSGDYTLQATYTGNGANSDQARGATSLDATNWYFSDKAGLYTNNTTAPVNSTNVRPIKNFGGIIYALSQNTTGVINTVSADSTTLTSLPGLPGDANATDFYMIASGVNGSTNDIIYVNDGGTINKFSLVSGSWVANGSATLTISADGICALNTGGGANIYVTTGTGAQVVEMFDNSGWNSTMIVNSAYNQVLYNGSVYLKGIDFVPVGTVSGGEVPLNSPPNLTADPNATVDHPFTNTFTDDPIWRTTITNITVNGVALPATAYNTNFAGKLIFTPSASAALQVAGSKTIVISATNYNLDEVIQYIGAGAPTGMAITTQPSAPAGNGGTLVVQPMVAITDQYGNPTTNTATCTATVDSGQWSIGSGSGTTVALIGGTTTFTNLSATSAGSVTGATITFTISGTGLGSLPYTITNSTAFNIPAPSTAFTAGNLVVEQEDVDAKNSTFSMVELNPAVANQAPVNTFAISATGSNALRQASSGSTGRLSDSQDGTLVCFSAALDGSSATADETTINPRGVGTLNANGDFTLQTTYTGIGGSTANQARSATSIDDLTWWIGDKGGVYTNLMTTPWVGGAANNVRALKAFGGAVYANQQYSTTLPDTAMQMVYTGGGAQELYPIDGFPDDPNITDFYMTRSGQNGDIYDTIYYIDPTNATSGVIFKYYYSGVDDNGYPSYSLAGSFLTGNGGDGFCAVTNAYGGANLYYTTGNGGVAGNSVVMLVDTAPWDAAPNIVESNVLYTCPPGATLKGIAFAPVAAPNSLIVTTLVASNINASSALLDGSVTVGTNAAAYWFQFGTSTAYGNVTATNTLPTGSTPNIVTSSISRLASGTVYHYQIVASNVVGYVYGPDMTFTTTTATATPPNMTPSHGGSVIVSGGSFSLGFTNVTGLTFSVLATNNITAPVSTWPVIGTVTENPPGSGQYQFTDPNPATNASKYYIIRQ